MGSMREVKL